MSSKILLIRRAAVEELTAPLIYPFRISSGRHDRLHNVLLRLECEGGIAGFGEAAVATHITGEIVEATRANLERAARWLVGKNVFDYRSISGDLGPELARNRSALAAVEMALMDALARRRGLPLWRLFGTTWHRVVTDITIVISELPETREAARVFCRQGFRTFKIKVGRDIDADIRRVRAVAKIAPRAKIILDANQAFTADQALAFLAELRSAGIRPGLIEQPVARDDWEGLEKVAREARASRVRVCADESASSLRDVRRIIRTRAADVINIKLMKTGILEAREITRLAVRHGAGLMIGSMMESPLSACAAAHFAGGTGVFTYVDLDTPFFIKGDALTGAHLSPNGEYDLREVTDGIGVTPYVKGKTSDE